MANVHAEYAVHLGEGLHLVERHLNDGLLTDAAPDGHTQFSHSGVCVGSIFVCHFYDERQHGLLCFLSVCCPTLHFCFLLRHANHRIGGQHTLRLYSQHIHEHDGSNHQPFHHSFHIIFVLLLSVLKKWQYSDYSKSGISKFGVIHEMPDLCSSPPPR